MKNDLKMKLVRSLVWIVLTYGAECWTPTNADEERIESADLWIYLGCYESVAGIEHRTDQSILTELKYEDTWPRRIYSS